MTELMVSDCAAGHDLARHHLGQRQLERGRAVRGELLHDVALRHDADHAPVGAGHDQRADPALGQKLGRGGEVGGGLDGDDVAALWRTGWL